LGVRIKRLATSFPDEVFLSTRGTRLQEAIRVFRITKEFIMGFRTLHFIGPAVTVFGSARFNEGHEYYEMGRKLGELLASHHFAVITGGGPGLMEAANRGCKEAGGVSIGCNIQLPREQDPNRHQTKSLTFRYFFVRKVMLVKYAYAFFILPGGLGTIDEMTEAMTLIQTGRVYDFPVILIGHDYWKGFMDWIYSTVVKAGAISHEDLLNVHLVATPEEGIEILTKLSRALDLENRIGEKRIDRDKNGKTKFPRA